MSFSKGLYQSFDSLSAAVLFFSMESTVPGGSLLKASSGGANNVKGPPSVKQSIGLLIYSYFINALHVKKNII